MLNLDPTSEELTVSDAPELLNTISDGVLVIDAEWRCRFANIAIETMFPRARESVIGKPLWDILPIERNGGLIAQLKRALAERRTRLISWTADDNMRIQMYAVPGENAITLLLRVDYLVRHAARVAAESEARYRTVFEQSPDGIVIFDAESRVADCNEAFARLLRSSRNSIIGLQIDDLRDQRFRDALRAALTGRVIRFDSPYESTTSRLKLWLAGTFAPLRDASGAVTGAIVIVKDRTEHIEAQRTLAETEKQYRQLVEHLPEAVFVQIDERIAYANPAAARLLGAKDPEALNGLSLVDLLHPSQRDEMRHALQNVLEKGELVARVEQKYLCFDGQSTTDVEAFAIPFRYQGRSSILTVARDINARKRAEARLVQAQHLEGVGLLASSVAHDFNNLLLVILASAGMLLEEPANAQLVAEGANEIEAAARRGSALTRQLMDWNRRDTALRTAYSNLNDVVMKEEPILRRLLTRRTELSIGISEDVGTICADANRVGQALVNLVVNARDAMPDGGTVTIETFTTRVLQRDKSIGASLAPGVYATLAVRDTGVGISDEMKARIFEPFFTTKPSGQGTGLGLTIVRDVVLESGGFIFVQSAPGLGTSFVIYWRRASALPDAA
jgi:two-component system cell cycle sensor histidine kinase/response regulator CckA